MQRADASVLLDCMASYTSNFAACMKPHKSLSTCSTEGQVALSSNKIPGLINSQGGHHQQIEAKTANDHAKPRARVVVGS